MDILGVVTRVPLLIFGVDRYDDDFADRINYKYTSAILVIFAIIVTNRQFGQKQIQCWVPAYFTRNYEEYINDICWVSNTYYVGLDQRLPSIESERKSTELKYYQWVPFILLLEAFFFYIPHILWRSLATRSGIDIRDLVEAASNYKSVEKYDKREKYLNYMITSIDQYVDDPRRQRETRSRNIIRNSLTTLFIISGKFLGNYLVFLYIFIKLIFIANCVGQLIFLNVIFGKEFYRFGEETLMRIVQGRGWDTTNSHMFPKISMCDFRIREVGNPKISHRYSVQCVLPINLFNQQIFTFIWFWYCIVLFVNVYSLVVWVYRFMPHSREKYINRRINLIRNPLEKNLSEKPNIEPTRFQIELTKRFVNDYLEPDGAFMLRVLSSNTSDFVCTILIQRLWYHYCKSRKFSRDMYGNGRNDEEQQNVSESTSSQTSDSETSQVRRRSVRHEIGLSDSETTSLHSKLGYSRTNQRPSIPVQIITSPKTKKQPFHKHLFSFYKPKTKKVVTRVGSGSGSGSNAGIIMGSPPLYARTISYDPTRTQYEKTKKTMFHDDLYSTIVSSKSPRSQQPQRVVETET